MEIAFEPVRVAVRGGEEGRLAFADGRLVAVFVRLSEDYDDHAGSWFMEVGFDRLDGPKHPAFPDLDTAERYLLARLSGLVR